MFNVKPRIIHLCNPVKVTGTCLPLAVSLQVGQPSLALLSTLQSSLRRSLALKVVPKIVQQQQERQIKSSLKYSNRMAQKRFLQQYQRRLQWRPQRRARRLWQTLCGRLGQQRPRYLASLPQRTLRLKSWIHSVSSPALRR